MSYPACAARALLNKSPFFRLRSTEERVGIVFFAAMLFFAMSQSLLAHEFKVGALEIRHPWSRESPEGAKVAAGYMAIRNEGSEPDRLVGVTGEIAGKAEIHEMAVNAEGVMTMRQLADGIVIPVGDEIELKPGGFHIMFLGLKQRVKEGDRFKGTLTFEKAGTVDIEFAVEAMGGEANHAGGHGG